MKTSRAWLLLVLVAAAPADAAAQVSVDTITDLAVNEEPQGSGFVTLRWTCPTVHLDLPGLPPSQHDPVEYDFRASGRLITETNFMDAHRITDGIPSPPSGRSTVEQVVVQGLTPDKIYYLAVKAKGQVGNLEVWSAMSPVVAFDLDRSPPGAPEGLEVDALAATAIVLRWPVPDSDVVDIRICFGDGTPVSDWQSVLRGRHSVDDLTPSTLYRFSAQFRDPSLNVGPLSEPIEAVTTPPDDEEESGGRMPCPAAAAGTAFRIAILLAIAIGLSAKRFRPDAQ